MLRATEQRIGKKAADYEIEIFVRVIPEADMFRKAAGVEKGVIRREESEVGNGLMAGVGCENEIRPELDGMPAVSR